MSAHSGNSTRENRIPRPFGVTLLALGVLTIAGLNLTRFIEAINLKDFLSGFPAVPVFYLALSGLLWGVAALPLIWGLWIGRKWAPRYTILYALVYSFFYWVDRLVSEVHGPERNFPFVAGTNFLLLLTTWWILSRKNARYFFGELHER